MTQRAHKTIYAALTALTIVGTFEGLIAILNLNQPGLYFKTAFWLGWFYVIAVALLYDLHYKERKSSEATIYAIEKRFKHLLDWKFIKEWFHYLILPCLIYWGSLGVFFVSFGFPKVQQIFAVLSSTAFFFNYLYLKEIFYRGKEAVDKDIFVVLTVVKIYASTLVYGAALALVKSYCLNGWYLALAVFALTFLLIYQALFQHRLVLLSNLLITLGISVVVAIIGYGVLSLWSYNYFTAAVFLTACYNLLWGVFHYHLDHALTWEAFWEIFVISIIVAAMVFSATNFRARIFDTCQYQLVPTGKFYNQ